jgi:aminoglycoside phosphotransferase family enzyme/predicted kinase
MTPGGTADITETHSSVVVFVGDRAYKLKKPVRLDFLNFSTRESREAATHREVELNRRIAPDVYLGVADVIGPDGTVCDHLVVMRRMPDDRRLSKLVSSGVPLDAEVRVIARVVADFHARAQVSAEIIAAGAPDALRAKLEADLTQMAVYAGSVLEGPSLEEAGALARRYLAGRTRLLDRRAATGHVRDGHGDLLADDIFCLPDGPRILDCIEFDDRLRYGDILADVAFLAMDLERLGAPQIADRFLAWYEEFSGEHHPATLAHYYIACRALVRSKVACIRARQGDHDARHDAPALLELALTHLRRGRVRLAVVGGAPGTGKSTVAAAIADRLGWAVLHSDEVRKDLVGLPHDARATADLRKGIYDPVTTEATYRELLARARRALELGEPLVLDASWTDAQRRVDARRLALETASTLVELRCEAAPDVSVRRIRARLTQAGEASDATPAIAAAMRAAADPWPEATIITTEVPLDESVQTALAALGAS